MATLTTLPRQCAYSTMQLADIAVDEGAKVIRGMSVITLGEAKGHGAWIDAEMLQQVVDAANASERGIQSRFLHPIDRDSLGTHLGRAFTFRVEGDRVRADLKISELADNSPVLGNLGTYVLGLAKDEPDTFGASIAFEMDVDAVHNFIEKHTVDGEFQSPDPKNTQNLPHARLAVLKAVDIVGEPAANPAGLFQESITMPEEKLAEQAQVEQLMDPEVEEEEKEMMEPDSIEAKVSELQSQIAALQEALNGVISKMQGEDAGDEELPEEEEEVQASAPQFAMSKSEAQEFLSVQVALGKIHPAQVEAYSLALSTSSPTGAVALIDAIKANKPADTFLEQASVPEAKQEGKQENTRTDLEGDALYESEWKNMGKSERLAFKDKDSYFAVRKAEDTGFFVEG